MIGAEGGTVGSTALSAYHVARIVQRRARLGGLEGDWAAHRLRSGFVTEAGRQGVPLGEVMATTEHRGVSTVMGYFQTGSLVTSRASTLLTTAPEPREPGSA
jgi:hypothetical protein